VALRELHEVYEPSLDEVTWARGLARSSEHLLALVVLLKCFQHLGYFPKLAEVPEVIVAHVRSSLELEEGYGRSMSRSAPGSATGSSCAAGWVWPTIPSEREGSRKRRSGPKPRSRTTRPT
jgi:Domain of unknown function (DUF4158)